MQIGVRVIQKLNFVMNIFAESSLIQYHNGQQWHYLVKFLGVLLLLISKGESGSPAGLATCDQNRLSIHPTLANFKALIMEFC